MNNAGFIFLIDALANDDERNDLKLFRRELRDASDPLTLPEHIFRAAYRFTRQMAHDLILELGQHLPDSNDELAVPKKLKILVTLHVYAHGSYQKVAGHDHVVAMSQASVSRCVDAVTAVINDHMNYMIQFPQTEEEKNVEKQRFMNVPYGFPGIIGAIDCTHVSIQTPKFDDEEFPAILFLNRKGFYSLNVQIIVNANLRILAVNARFPGSVHDSAIWMTSAIKQHLMRNFAEGNRSSWLIGDSGYPLEPWLLTPVAGANLNDQERAYNNAHIHVRNVIERLNGNLKSRFRCLMKHRTLHYHPVKAAKIVNACCILHNLFLARNGPECLDNINENDQDVDEPQDNNAEVEDNLLQIGRNVRQRIIQSYF